MSGLPKRIVNRWTPVASARIRRASILQHTVHPEGLDVDRYRFEEPDHLPLPSDHAHLVSVIRGSGALDSEQRYGLEPGVHIYVPPERTVSLRGDTGAEFIVVSAPASLARADRVVVRDERFVRACATEDRSLRWVLTPQYLSRRLFLHHDAVLSSKSGRPVSWFRTTMFDVDGLPPNDEGESVFKMSYDHRTEPNFCYEVVGEARVRFAERPYEANTWSAWQPLDGETTYHLNEPEGVPRNKHEVLARGGHATLFCMFDPAPTGVEQHTTGAYSSYGALDAVLGTERYARVLESHRLLDEMLDTLSVQRALNMKLDTGPLWDRYQKGLAAQRRIEATCFAELGEARRAIVEPWLLQAITP